MRFLDSERGSLELLLPGLDSGLASVPLAEREHPDGRSIEIFRGCGGPGLLVPTTHGGLGASAVDAVRVQRAVGARCPSLAVATTMHHFSVASLIEASHVGQGFEWMLVEAIAVEKKLVASGFAEGVRGQSILRPGLRCRRDGDRYLVSGAKRPCSLARSMHLLTASVVVDGRGGEELAVAVIPATAPGLVVEPFWNAPVLRGAESEAVILDDVAIDEPLLVRIGSVESTALDHVQSAGFLWFELLMTASYLGVASGLVEQMLTEARGEPGQRAAAAGALEAVMASLEGVAMMLSSCGPSDELLVKVLFCRYAAQDAINHVVSMTLEQLGGMTFIRDDTVHYFAEATRCLAFHPPSRSRTSGALLGALNGLPLEIA